MRALELRLTGVMFLRFCQQDMERVEFINCFLAKLFTSNPNASVSVISRHINTRPTASPEKNSEDMNRPYSYSRYWTGTSLQLRLMQGIYAIINDIPPHEPPFQASSNPIPRIRIWPIDWAWPSFRPFERLNRTFTWNFPLLSANMPLQLDDLLCQIHEVNSRLNSAFEKFPKQVVTRCLVYRIFVVFFSKIL